MESEENRTKTLFRDDGLLPRGTLEPLDQIELDDQHKRK